MNPEYCEIRLDGLSRDELQVLRAALRFALESPKGFVAAPDIAASLTEKLDAALDSVFPGQ